MQALIMATRYITSPIAGKPGHRKVFDTKKNRHLKNNSGGDEYLKDVAEALCKRKNVEDSN